MAYTSVTVEGGLFSADLLDRIAIGDADGQKSTEFWLDGNRRLVDEIQSAFSDARSFWDAFQRRLETSRESPTTITRENWIIPFLELVGFYDVRVQRSSAEAGGESFFISHRFGDDPDAPPVHVVAVDQEIDRRDGARRSPHALVQDYLNRSNALWGITTNGRRLRLLRDSERLAKPTYLEFDLEGMVEGNLYSEFVLLYRLIHGTRFPRDGAGAHDSFLERYYQQSIDEGGRVREKLRDGVEETLKVLGTAFLAHPDSTELREKFERNQLDAPRYYRQLLRLVYRVLFLMVAEERRLIFPPDSDVDRQAIYSRYYGIGRLRNRADRYFAGDKNSDLWLSLRQTFRLCRDDDHAHKLGLSALNGELFGADACADLEGAGCRNDSLLTAIRHLSTFLDDGGSRGRRSAGIRRRVNYAGLDVEEFGSVYESLLDFHPEVSLDPPQFDLVTGSERKQTGSYYTPPELVRELIESALVPVMEEKLTAAKGSEARAQALLDLRICDPAAGSGHFLLAAARRIARELAKVRSDEDEPSPADYRTSLRDVIRQCIYAVDKNPLAVDLCKVALWMEGHNAGLPLSFLDHHVKCGDSLVGVFDLRVLEEGIPDEAYKAVTGDDKTAAKWYRQRNKKEREGQLGLALGDKHPEMPDDLADELREMARREERKPADVHAKEDLYGKLHSRGSEWWKLKVACDLWTYAFFAPIPKRDGAVPPGVPTTDVIRQHLLSNSAHPTLVGAAVACSQFHAFFHWPIEFPDIMRNAGFDVVLGNPPFLGSKKVKGSLGDNYRDYLMNVFAPAAGLSDLGAYFLRHMYRSLQLGGRLGMVATNSLNQGDSREGGLAVVLKTGTVVFTRRFIQWPGAANLEVNLLSIHKGDWEGTRILDGRDVPFISSRLDEEPETEAARLTRAKRGAHIGSVVAGSGFILARDKAEALLTGNSSNRECIFRYLTGEDLNSSVDQSPSRWIINFFDWPLSKAQLYPELLNIVRERVKPQRDKVNRDRYRTRWWLYAEPCPGFYEAIAGLDRFLVKALTSDIHAFAFVPTGYVYSHSLGGFPFDDDYRFALLQSNLHESWVRKNASTMRTDIRYTPTDCFETFPFPQDPPADDEELASHVGSEYHEHRRQTMLSRDLGLTKTYNLFHDSEIRDADLVRLRDLHAEMDRAILACYGWEDIDPGHGFHENERGKTRYTISPEARREVLRRLLGLNLAIAESERTGEPVKKAQKAAR